MCNGESISDLQPNSEMLPISAIEILLAQYLDFSSDPNGFELLQSASKSATKEIPPSSALQNFESPK